MTVPFESSIAGIWKQIDFPAPVGMMAITSFPERMVEITSSCTVRNVS